MLECDDTDMDINLLSDLLDKAENDERGEETLRTGTCKNEKSETQSFDSILEELDKIPVKTSSRNKLTDKTSLFNNQEVTKKSGITPSRNINGVVHTTDADSSDEEDHKRGAVPDDLGSSVRRMLKSADEEKRSGSLVLSDVKSRQSVLSSWKSPSSSPASNSTLCLPAKKEKINTVSYLDPSIGIRIINPLVSSTVMKERLVGRKVVSMDIVKQFVSDGKISDDWVIFGVIVSKAPPRTSSKGSLYSIIKLSDLRGPGNPKTISLFLFSSAFKTHGKDSVGTVLGVLNPGVLENSKNHGDEACLSVDNADRIMILGTSKDFGLCKSKKKNGENCTVVVNLAQCEYCVYHVKQEYQKCSRRSDIQSSFNGVGLTNLRNKVLGKNEVFYGGQSFSAIPAKKNQKLCEKDNKRMMALSGTLRSKASLDSKPLTKTGIATSIDLSYRQCKKDVERLKRLDGEDALNQSKPNKNVVTAQYNPDQIKPDVAKHAALALIADKRKAPEEKSSNEQSSSESEAVSHASSTVVDEKAIESDVLKDASVMNENVPFSRGVRATLTLKSNKQNPIGLTASSLGLGFSRNSDLNKAKDTVSSSNTVKAVKGVDQGTTPSGSNLKTSYKAKAKKPETTVLSSEQLRKLASKGMDFESRMLKQAAQKAAQQEEASKLNTFATPSMLGLGRGSSMPRPKTESALGISPRLGIGLSSSSIIDLDAPITKKISNAAKLNAISLIKRKGGIAKEDPNPRDFESRKKGSKENKVRQGVKRPREEHSFFCDNETPSTQENEELEAKKARFKKLMEATSRHTNLIDAAENEAQEEYFGKLEKKEQMEEKMLSTFKVDCKAVSCSVCKYTAFSASEFCKTERHPLKVINASKRFFKCGNCGNRTVSLQLLPTVSCSNCSSSQWERAAMIRERKVGITQETLSVRGMEETFIGSVTTGANINLLVPEEGT